MHVICCNILVFCFYLCLLLPSIGVYVQNHVRYKFYNYLNIYFIITDNVTVIFMQNRVIFWSEEKKMFLYYENGGISLAIMHIVRNRALSPETIFYLPYNHIYGIFIGTVAQSYDCHVILMQFKQSYFAYQ